MPEPRIPTYVLAYHDTPTVRRSLEWLTGFHDRLEIVVLENPSDRTETEIRPFVEQLVRDGRVAEYWLFDDNISNNAFEVALRDDVARWRPAPHVLVTDGDLVGPDAGWIEEQVRVLERHADVFACGMSLDMSNLPLEAFPDAGSWVPPATAVHDDHVVGRTGAHLLLMRPAELAGFLEHQRAHGLSLRDGELDRYAREVRGQHWARTVVARARHLTWDSYADPDHPYRVMKVAKDFGQHWNHGRYAGYRRLP